MSRKHKNWISAWVKSNEETESSPLYHKWVATSMVSANMQRKCWLKYGKLLIIPNIYVVLVGEPGGARKSQSISYGTKVLAQKPFAEEITVSADDITKEGLLEAIDHAKKTCLLRDGSMLTHSSMFIVSREFESFLGQKKENTKMLVLLTDLFDGKELPWVRKTKTSGSNYLENIFITMLAATTPTSLASSFPASAIGGGLTTRMIFVWSDGLHRKIPKPPETIMEQDLASDLQQILCLNGPYDYTREADEKYQDWYINYNERSPSRICQDIAFVGWYSRKPMMIQKLSMILAAAKRNQPVIEWEDVTDAIQMLEETEPGMAKAFNAVGRSEITADISQLLDYLRINGVTSDKALAFAMWRDVDAKRYQLILDTAHRAGFINRLYKCPKTGAGGLYFECADTTLPK